VVLYGAVAVSVLCNHCWWRSKLPLRFLVIFVTVVLLKVAMEMKDKWHHLNMRRKIRHTAVLSRLNGTPSEPGHTVVDTKALSISSVSRLLRLLRAKSITEITCRNLVIMNICKLYYNRTIVVVLNTTH